jgi:small subunit ribosomal protein S6
MREFETCFIVQPEISDEGCAELCTRLDGILEKSGARRVMLDDWGKRKLAYEIKHFQKGHYFFLHYLDARGQVVEELERVLRLEESVLRFLSVRADAKVTDVEARIAEGAEQERIQQEKAAERAAREAEAAAASAAHVAAPSEAAPSEAAPSEAAPTDPEAEAAESAEASAGEDADESAGEEEEAPREEKE